MLALGLDWIVGLSWVPFQGPLSLVDELTGSWTVLALVVLGVALGLVLALSVYGDVVYVTVEPQAVVVTRGDEVRRVPRSAVATVFLEGGHLVVQDASGRRGARAPVDHLPTDRLRAVFIGCGYRWVEADPLAGAFSRWFENAPGLPAGGDAILAARQKALDGGQEEAAEDLRVELDRVGVVVRDEGGRQFWRPVV
ncbi:hypothetical protein [Sanguibacter sp. 25GB23B1]|uniref:YqeB family protein n=1 Tax=Sanguibacter sp. 25GB23B1 TaxID=3156067 RepID=UPI0032AE8A8F